MMGIGTNTQKADEGELTREQEEVACGVWFTSQGNTLPKLLKFQDRDGTIQTIDHITVHSKEKKRYCGISVFEYRCSTSRGAYEYCFRLYYYIEDCKWKIAWNC